MTRYITNVIGPSWENRLFRHCPNSLSSNL